MKKSKKIENLENYKVIKLNAETVEEIQKKEREQLKNRKTKSEVKKIFSKRTVKNKISKKTYNLRNTKKEFTNKEFTEIKSISKRIVEKALKVVTYNMNNKWNIKQDNLIIDFNINLEDKADLVAECIENILYYGCILENTLYIKNRSFRSTKKQSLLYKNKHYKKINSLLYYKKKQAKNECNDIITVQKNGDELFTSDFQAFKDFIIDMYNNDIKLEYQKANKKQFAKNILELLKLSKKEIIIYNYVLNGVKYEDIASILELSKNTIKTTVFRINNKIDRLKKELYIEYMK